MKNNNVQITMDSVIHGLVKLLSENKLAEPMTNQKFRNYICREYLNPARAKEGLPPIKFDDDPRILQCLLLFDAYFAQEHAAFNGLNLLRRLKNLELNFKQSGALQFISLKWPHVGLRDLTCFQGELLADDWELLVNNLKAYVSSVIRRVDNQATATLTGAILEKLVKEWQYAYIQAHPQCYIRRKLAATATPSVSDTQSAFDIDGMDVPACSAFRDNIALIRDLRTAQSLNFATFISQARKISKRALVAYLARTLGYTHKQLNKACKLKALMAYSPEDLIKLENKLTQRKTQLLQVANQAKEAKKKTSVPVMTPAQMIAAANAQNEVQYHLITGPDLQLLIDQAAMAKIRATESTAVVAGANNDR